MVVALADVAEPKATALDLRAIEAQLSAALAVEREAARRRRIERDLDRTRLLAFKRDASAQEARKDAEILALLSEGKSVRAVARELRTGYHRVCRARAASRGRAVEPPEPPNAELTRAEPEATEELSRRRAADSGAPSDGDPYTAWASLLPPD